MDSRALVARYGEPNDGQMMKISVSKACKRFDANQKHCNKARNEITNSANIYQFQLHVDAVHRLVCEQKAPNRKRARKLFGERKKSKRRPQRSLIKLKIKDTRKIIIQNESSLSLSLSLSLA